ncbi:MAG: hypothetical protein ACXWQQ_04090 [Pseudobdellovibrio sp.]
MKKNKYLLFVGIGFEMVGLIVGAVYLGDYLVKQGFTKSAPAFCVIAAFIVWFTSLMIKLKNMKND